MITDELKVRIKVDASDARRETNQAKESLKGLEQQGEKSASALEKLKNAINNQTNRLKALKEEYTDVILSQNRTTEATQRLERQMTSLNAQLLANKQKLTEAGLAGAQFTSALDGHVGVDATTASVQELKDTLESLRNLQIADLIFDNWGAIKDRLGVAKSAFDNAKYEAGIGLDMSGFFEGDFTFKELLGSMKVQFSEAFKSLGSGFKALKDAGAAAFGGISGAAATAAAVIITVVAAVVAVVAALKNALNIAKQVKTNFYEAQKIGLNLREYEQWGYVLDSVGVGVDKLSDFMKTLAAEQNAVREGSKDVIAAFERIGLSAEEVANMTQSELFTKTVAGLQGIEDQVERTGLAYKIFGEDDAAQLINILNLNNQEMERLISNFYLLGGATSDSLIKKSTMLSSAVSNMKTAWQGLKNTLAEAIMPTLTVIINAIAKAIAVVNMFIRAIFGYDIVAKSNAKSASGASNGVNTYTNSVNNATAAVEKLRRVTLGFDELNIVGNPNTKSAGSGAGAGGGVNDIGSIGGGGLDISGIGDNLGLEKFAETIEKWKNVIRLVTPVALTAIGVIGAVACLLTGNWIGAVAFGAMAGLGIAIGIESGAWSDLIGGIKTWWSGTVVTWFNTHVKPVFTKAYWQEKWNNIKAPIATKLEEAKTAITNKWNEVKTWFNTNVAPKFTKAYWIEKFDAIKQSASTKLTETKTTISNKYDEVKTWFNKNVAPKFTKAYWSEKFDSIKQSASTKLSEAKTAITGKWDEVRDWFSKNVAPKFTKAYWVEKWNNIKEAAITKLKEVKTNILTIWNEIKIAFGNIGTTIANSISGAVKSAINKVLKDAIGKVNSFIRLINGALTYINKIPGVDIPKLKELSVPQLAKGGIVTSDTLARIGENGKREAVLPLEQNTGWMDMLADRIAARSNNNDSRQEVILMVGETELGRATIKAINGITRQTGGLQLVL